MVQNTPSLLMNNTAGYMKWITLVLLFLFLGGIQPLLAQDSTAVAEETEDAIIKTKLTLTGSQFPDGTIQLQALLRSKIEGSYQKTPNQKVAFFLLSHLIKPTSREAFHPRPTPLFGGQRV